MRRNVVRFMKLSEQGEQRCSEPSVVCLGDTEDIFVCLNIFRVDEVRAGPVAF